MNTQVIYLSILLINFIAIGKDSNAQSSASSFGAGNFSSTHGGISKSYKPNQNESTQLTFNNNANFSASHGGITKTYNNNQPTNSSKFNAKIAQSPSFNSNFYQVQSNLPDYSDDVEMGDYSDFPGDTPVESIEHSKPLNASKLSKSIVKQPLKQKQSAESAPKSADKLNNQIFSSEEIVLKVEGYPTNTKPSDLQDHFKFFGNVRFTNMKYELKFLLS